VVTVKLIVRLFVAMVLSSVLVACNSNGEITPAQRDRFSAPSELERSWRASMVRVPDGNGGVISTTIAELESGGFNPTEQYPVAIYMHGCDGFWSGTQFRVDWLARLGFVVIAPNSFAREFYPQSCDLSTYTAGMYRPSLRIRQFDAGNAIERARAFSWADKDNIMLIGLSEGAAVVSTYSNPNNPAGYLKARVVEGWGCHVAWPEYAGINAPDSEAVLAIVADRDPWYTARHHQGDCGVFMNTNNGSQSYVVDYEPLRYEHVLWEAPEIQEIIRTFLLQQLIRVK